MRRGTAPLSLCCALLGAVLLASAGAGGRALPPPHAASPAVAPTTITGLQTNVQGGGEVVYVRLTLASGITGLGQFGEPWRDSNQSGWCVSLFHDAIAPVALGTRLEDFQNTSRLAWERYYKNSGETFFRALAGFDSAAWDALGKVRNESVCTMVRQQFGLSDPCPARFPVYGSSLSRTVSPAVLAGKLRGLQASHGVRAFKVKVAQRMGHNIDVYPNRSQEIVAACRAAVGPGTPLMVDANSGYTEHTAALELAGFLRALNITWFEEPCVWNDLQCARAVQEQGGIPVALGEQEYRLYEDWRQLLAVGATKDPVAAAIAQPDVGYVGGLSRALQVARWAQAAGDRFVPHSPGATLNTLITLHLMAGLPATLAAPWMEFGCVDGGIPSGSFTPGFDLRDGALAVPTGPGWGVSIRPALLLRGALRTSRLA